MNNDVTAAEVYLPLSLLEEGSVDDVFKSLSKTAFSQLEESILRTGRIQESLKVIPNERGKYTVWDGKHRLKIAIKHNISPVKCEIRPVTDIDGILDINIYRRHMDEGERISCIKKKVEKVKAVLDEYVLHKLIPEFEALYSEGKIPANMLPFVLNCSRDEQLTLVESFTTEIEVKDTEEEDRLRNQLEEVNEKLQKTRAAVNEKDGLISKLKDKQREIEERAKEKIEKIANIEKQGSKTEKVHEKELEEMRMDLVGMSHTLKKNKSELEKLIEEKGKYEREIGQNKTEIALLKQNLELNKKTFEERDKENRRKFYNPKGILRRCDMVKEDVEDIYDSVVSIPPTVMHLDMPSMVIEKMEKIKDKADEVIKKAKELVKVLEKAA